MARRSTRVPCAPRNTRLHRGFARRADVEHRRVHRDPLRGGRRGAPPVAVPRSRSLGGGRRTPRESQPRRGVARRTTELSRLAGPAAGVHRIGGHRLRQHQPQAGARPRAGDADGASGHSRLLQRARTPTAPGPAVHGRARRERTRRLRGHQLPPLATALRRRAGCRRPSPAGPVTRLHDPWRHACRLRLSGRSRRPDGRVDPECLPPGRPGPRQRLLVPTAGRRPASGQRHPRGRPSADGADHVPACRRDAALVHRSVRPRSSRCRMR